MFSAKEFLDFQQTEHRCIFYDESPVWSALSHIGDYLGEKLSAIEAEEDRLQGQIDARAVVGSAVFVAKGATVEANAVIKGPAWIGEGTTVRSGAYVRENVIVGNNCMLGNSSEFKNCILFNNCEVPHFNYVGDSILGYKAHLGAGVVCSNVRLDRANVQVKNPRSGERIDTGLTKLGAIVGDRAEVGCNTVMSPGSILGRDCIIHPCTHWHGVLGEHQIVKNVGNFEVVKRTL